MLVFFFANQAYFYIAIAWNAFSMIGGTCKRLFFSALVDDEMAGVATGSDAVLVCRLPCRVFTSHPVWCMLNVVNTLCYIRYDHATSLPTSSASSSARQASWWSSLF
jgi:hypothetical protein